MSSFLIKQDSHIMMLEFMVEKLCVPSTCPFDAVICSKFITSFRFLDDEWVDMVPNRLDYKRYQGSNSQEINYHGGKSVVFSVPKYMLREKSEGAILEIFVRREISRYFETDAHVEPIGRLTINVDDLINGIVEEMSVRCQLAKYLKLVHNQDPVSSTLKGGYLLQDPCTNEMTSGCIQIYVRLSFMGECIITEIKRMSRDPCDDYYYVEEQTNLGMPYECHELDCEGIPTSKFPLYPPHYERTCECTDEQKYQLLLDHCTKAICTDPCDDGNNKNKNKKKKKKKRKNKGVGTDAGTADKGVGTDGQKSDKNKTRDFDLSNLPKRKKRRGSGGGPMVMIEKSQPCEPVCVPCEPCCVPVCVTDAGNLCVPACPPPVYC